jgi:hypothetical protein
MAGAAISLASIKEQIDVSPARRRLVHEDGIPDDRVDHAMNEYLQLLFVVA